MKLDNEKFLEYLNSKKYGIELEGVLDENYRDELDSYLEDNLLNVGFETQEDGSISCENGNEGFELVSHPLKFEKRNNMWVEIEKIKKEFSISVNSSCGYHLHIDTADFSMQDIKRLYKNLQNIQSWIFMGLSKSRLMNSYCKPLCDEYKSHKEFLKKKFELDKKQDAKGQGKYNSGRYDWLNIWSHLQYDNIEIRCHNGTFEENKINNWLEFWMYIVCITKYYKKNNLSVKWIKENMNWFYVYWEERISQKKNEKLRYIKEELEYKYRTLQLKLSGGTFLSLDEETKIKNACREIVDELFEKVRNINTIDELRKNAVDDANRYNKNNFNVFDYIFQGKLECFNVNFYDKNFNPVFQGRDNIGKLSFSTKQFGNSISVEFSDWRYKIYFKENEYIQYIKNELKRKDILSNLDINLDRINNLIREKNKNYDFYNKILVENGVSIVELKDKNKIIDMINFWADEKIMSFVENLKQWCFELNHKIGVESKKEARKAYIERNKSQLELDNIEL